MSGQSKHALLSASAAHRWLHCTAAPRLEFTLPEKTSEHADAGTLAHSIAELKLKKAYIDPNMTARAFNTKINKLKKHPLYKPEMMKNTDVYADYIASLVHSMNLPPYIAVEKRVDYSHIAPEGFGTADCILISGDTLYIVDYKNGRGVPVSAVENPQLKLYALGAAHEYAILYDVRKVNLSIVQPNLDSITQWETSREELEAWGKALNR